MKESNPKDEYEFLDSPVGEGTTGIKYEAMRKSDRKVFFYSTKQENIRC
jgi:hypothetical protein